MLLMAQSFLAKDCTNLKTQWNSTSFKMIRYTIGHSKDSIIDDALWKPTLGGLLC